MLAANSRLFHDLALEAQSVEIQAWLTDYLYTDPEKRHP